MPWTWSEATARLSLLIEFSWSATPASLEVNPASRRHRVCRAVGARLVHEGTGGTTMP